MWINEEWRFRSIPTITFSLRCFQCPRSGSNLVGGCCSCLDIHWTCSQHLYLLLETCTRDPETRRLSPPLLRTHNAINVQPEPLFFQTLCVLSIHTVIGENRSFVHRSCVAASPTHSYQLSGHTFTLLSPKHPSRRPDRGVEHASLAAQKYQWYYPFLLPYYQPGEKPYLLCKAATALQMVVHSSHPCPSSGICLPLPRTNYVLPLADSDSLLMQQATSPHRPSPLFVGR